MPHLDTDLDPRVALLVGEAARRKNDSGALLRAADRLLQLDPGQVRPLIWQGDVYWSRGELARAGHYYASALARADAAPVPPALAIELTRIDKIMAGLRHELSRFLSDWLTERGFPHEALTPRIRESIAILSGTLDPEMGMQRPTQHYVPGLTQCAWFDRKDFAWAEELEAQTRAIRDELLDLLSDDAAFAPYIEGGTHGPARDYQGLLNNPAWGAFYLWRDGVPQSANIARCPMTAAALKSVPRPQIPGRTPTAMFSLLKPGTHIPPHHGMLNARLIGHLPLIVPDNCAMRVGDEVRPWHVGHLTIFDDSIEHEAWNDSAETRVVLLFDIARPELDAAENEVIAQCFAAVDAYRDSNDGAALNRP